MYKSISVMLLSAISLSTFGAMSAVAHQTFQGLKNESQESELCTNSCTDRGSGRREQRHNQAKPNADLAQTKRRGSGRIAPNPTTLKGFEFAQGLAH